MIGRGDRPGDHHCVAGAGWLRARSFAINLGTGQRRLRARRPPGLRCQHATVAHLPARRRPGDAPPCFRSGSWRGAGELTERLRAIGGVTAVASAATCHAVGHRSRRRAVHRRPGRSRGSRSSACRARHSARRRGLLRHDGDSSLGLINGRRFTADDQRRNGTRGHRQPVVRPSIHGGKDPLTAKFTAGYPEVPKAPVLRSWVSWRM